jgi:hypothetical protein
VGDLTVDAVPDARAFRGRAGVARRDITPPEGIAIRNWGAAPDPVSKGVHRPLTATALAFSPDGGDPCVLVAADLGWWRTHADEWKVRGRLLDTLGLAPERLVLALSHTHAGPSLRAADDGRPGWELVEPYLAHVTEAAADAAREALASSRQAELAFATGWSGLATDRDLAVDGSILCGFNPRGTPDGTLVVGRVATADGALLATVVNYACHPTTLAWENAAISPDWVGAMRELVEGATGDAPCLFLQGASGELAPLEQYTGAFETADGNGRRLGHAVLAVLEGLPRPFCRFELTGRVESGTAAAVWQQRRAAGSAASTCVRRTVTLPLRRPEPIGELRRRWGDVGEAQLRERLSRLENVRRAVGGGPDVEVPYWVWRLGDAIVVAQPCEAYSQLQVELRSRLSPHPVVVVGVANGCTLGYLVPSDRYDERYQAWQSPFAPGTLELLTDACERSARELLAAAASRAA